MASTYLKSDPRSAIEWLLSLEGGRVDGLAMVQSQFTPETVQIAQSMLNEVSEPAQREQLVRALAMHKVRDNPAQALEWLAQYPDHSKYADIHANALHHWASSDPAGATSALEQRWYEPQMTESFRTVAWSLGQRNPQEAVDWARSLPESPGRDAAFSSLVQMVAQRNPEQARSLYESLPAGKDRDRAGAALANQLAGGDPERMRETMAELGMSRDAIEAYLLIWTR